MKNKGFTLIELLVVVAIIGFLASVVMSSLDSAREKARNAQRYSDLRQIQSALEMYRNDHSGYPVQATWRTECTSWAGGLPADQVIPGLVPTYLPKMPADPSMTQPNKNCYIYRSTADGSDYKLLDYNVVSMTSAPPTALIDHARNVGQSWANNTACPAATEVTKTLAVWSGGATECY